MSDVTDLFRVRYPAFTSVTTWSDATLETVMEYADAECGGRGWGAYDTPAKNFKQRGMFLYAAHYLASYYPSGEASTSGGSKASTASKSVGDESISYNQATVTTQGDQWLSSTAFGQQFMMLRRRAGMGARAV